MQTLIAILEWAATMAALSAALTHGGAWLIARRDIRSAEWMGIKNGSMMLFRQNRRSELARTHLKLTLFALGIYTIHRPNPAGELARWYALILVLVTGAIIHAATCSILDLMERQTLKRKHFEARQRAILAGAWNGDDRRAV